MVPNFEDSLITTASAGDVDRMRTLLLAGQESLSEETTQKLLAIATKSCHLHVVNFLLNQYCSVPLNEDIVRGAINTGSIPIFEALLARDPSIINMHFDMRGTPLIVACMGQQTVRYLQFLLEAGADPNQDPDAAIFPLALVAALYTDPSAIDLLLRNGARIEHSGSLAAAARLGNEPMILRLLGRGAQLEADASATGPNISPLHVAVKSGHDSVAKILIQHGADPNAIDASGSTAIEIANQMMLDGKDVTEMLEVLKGEKG